MKKIVILYEHVVREYRSCIALKELLEKDGYADVHVLSFQYELWSLRRLSRRGAIDCVVVPYAYSEKSLAPIKFLFKSNTPPLIVNLHHEQIAARFDEHKLLPRDWTTKFRVIHFVWGESFRQRLIDVDIPERLIFKTGNIRVLTTPKNKSRGELAGQYNLDESKKWIMICESGYIIHSEAEIDDRVKKRGYHRQDLEDRNRYLQSTNVQIEQQLANLNERFFDTFEVIYRAHPGREQTLKVGQSIMRIDGEDIHVWFPHLSAMLSRISTVLHEADKYKVLPVRYDPVTIPKKLLPRGLEHYQYITSFEDIETLLNNENKWATGEQSKNYLGDSKTAEQIVVSIKKVLSDPLFQNDFRKIEFKSKTITWPRLICNMLGPFVAKYKYNWNCRFCKSLSRIFIDGPPKWVNQHVKK